jgi:hypothetical protein
MYVIVCLNTKPQKEYWERNAKANFRIPSSDIGAEADPAYTGKVLQLEFAVEDEGVFTMPWSATVTYRRGLNEQQDSCVARTGGNPQSVRLTPEAAKSDF